MKRKLLIIDAPDRAGKDTILNSMVPTRNLHVYKQNNTGIPHYRDQQDDFGTWLRNFLVRQNQLIIDQKVSHDRDVVMARLFTSDYVYSEFFNRSSNIDQIYSELEPHFDFYQFIILFKDYDEYLERCKVSESEIEYSKDEFDRIQYLYLTSKFNKMMPTVIRMGANEPSWHNREICMNMLGDQ